MNKEESNEICKSNNAEKTSSAAVIETKSSLDAVFRRKFQAFVALVTLVFFLAWAEVCC